MLDVDKHGDVHCFIPNQSDTDLVLFGADWQLDRVRQAIAKYGAEVAGLSALSMQHGVGVSGHIAGPFFFRTKKEWTDAQIARFEALSAAPQAPHSD